MQRNWIRISLAAVAVIYLVNFGFLGFIIGPYDYDHLSGYYEIAWRFWQSGTPLPHYNPLLCGGRTLGGDPQTPVFHPLVFLVPLIGPTWLIKLEMLAQLAVGVLCLRRWLRRFGRPSEAIDLATLIFVAGGAVTARFLVGHVTLGFYFLLPAFFYLSERLIESTGRPAARLFAVYAALFAYCGLYKPNFIIYFLPPLILEHLARAYFKRSWKLLFYFGAAILTMGALDAVTYLPSALYFHDHPRLYGQGAYTVPLYTLIANLLLPLRTLPNSWYGEHFLQRHEYTQFVGPLALVLAARGFRRWPSNLAAEKKSLLLFAILSAWMGLGSSDFSFHPTQSFTWFYGWWPGFQSIRVVTRFWFSVTFVVVTLAAFGWESPRTRLGRVGYFVFLILPLVGSAAVSLTLTTYGVKTTQWAVPRIYPEAMIWTDEDPLDSYAPIRQGKGVLQCIYNVENHQSALVGVGDRLTLQPPRPDVTVRAIDWNTIALVAPPGSPETLSLNFNHDAAWEFKGEGGHIVSKNGYPLAIAVDKGGARGRLVYTQRGLVTAIWISALSAVTATFLLLALIIGGRRRLK